MTIDLNKRTRCLDCGIDCTTGGNWYMVRDAVWGATGLGPEDGVLCFADLRRRLGRPCVSPISRAMFRSTAIIMRR
jgi:hypothetical protein